MKQVLSESSGLWKLVVALSLTGTVACSSGGSTETPDAGPGNQIDAAPETDAEVSDMCGDGIVGDSEECDDNNLDTEDGCDDQCKIETGYECVGEPSACSPICGDSLLTAPETCDDGNGAANDGCSDACLIEDGFVCPTVGEACVAFDGTCALPFPLLLTDNAGVLEGSVAEDTTGGASGLAAALCDGASVGDGADLNFTFTIPDTRDVTITSTSTFDGLFRVLTTSCDLTTPALGEVAFGDACANQAVGIDSEESLTLHNLAAGTYFILVDGVAAEDEGSFTLALSAAVTTCGDGVVDAGEECDDMNDVLADGCSNCVLEPLFRCTGEPSVCASTCQDGIVDVDAQEECDDGNAINDDRCSDVCTLEFDVLDTEPNDAIGDAQTVSAGQTIVGSLSAGDFDVYELVLADDSWITLEGYNTIDGDATNYNGNGQLGPVPDCVNANDLDLHLFDENADVTDVSTSLVSDDFDGVGFCPYIGPNRDRPASFLVAGTYYIRVDAFSEANSIPHYAVDLRIDAPLASADACETGFDLCNPESLSCSTETLLCEELCGNGVLDPAEECDDSNLVDDDRCSNACQLVFDVLDVDGNDSFATAQPLASGEIAKGSLDPNGADEFDLYTFTLADPAWVILEEYTFVDSDLTNYDGLGQDPSMDCSEDPDLRLFDAAGDPTDNTSALVSNDFQGDGNCGYIGPNTDGAVTLLAAGTYFIKVNEFSDNDAVPVYALDFQTEAVLEAGDACDPDFDLCNPANLACIPGTNTCAVPPPEDIDRANFEQFNGDFDLSNSSIFFTPIAGSYGVETTTGVAIFPDTPGLGTVASQVLNLSDDASEEVAFAMNFPFFEVDENSVFVNSNGNLSFGVSNINALENTTLHFSIPRISFFFNDLNPSAAGTITFDEFADRVVITFEGVEEFGGAGVTVTAQVQLFANGNIVITHLDTIASDCIVGISAGDDLVNPPDAIDFSAQISSAPLAGDLIINEALLNSAGADANCDGTISTTDDEFVELVNVSGHPLDLTGLTVADAVQTRHVFEAFVLPHNQAVVIYGGGASLCPGILGVTASAGNLGLNNSGDTVTLGTGDTVTFGTSTAGISLTRSPDIEGADFFDHNLAGGSVTNFSPGTRATGRPF